MSTKMVVQYLILVFAHTFIYNARISYCGVLPLGKRVTVYDIANELGISPSTVSRVLNNSNLISDKRIREIRATAKRMGYEKRIIKRHQSRTILNIHLFLAKTEEHITHLFYNISELVESIQSGFEDIQLNITLRVNDGDLNFLKRKKTGQIDGCIFAFTQPGKKLAQALSEREIPFVLLNRKNEEYNFVAYDVGQGFQELSHRLHQSIGSNIRPCYIGFSQLPEVSQERYQAVKTYFTNNNIPFDSSQLYNITHFSKNPSHIIHWIQDNNFNSILAFNDLVAFSILEAGLARGLQFPEDIGLTGCDNSPLQALLDRRINTVSLSPVELGQSTGAWLKSRIIDKDDTLLQDTLKVRYIPGDTIAH